MKREKGARHRERFAGGGTEGVKGMGVIKDEGLGRKRPRDVRRTEMSCKIISALSGCGPAQHQSWNTVY